MKNKETQPSSEAPEKSGAEVASSNDVIENADPQPSRKKSFTLRSLPPRIKDALLRIVRRFFTLILYPFIALAILLRVLDDKVLSRASIVGALIVIFHFLTAIFDPFRTDTYGDRQVSDFFDVVSSPLYGGWDRVAQSEILVILITPENMETRFGGGFWPPSYDAQLAILEKIATYSPTAIFLDFYYFRPQQEAGSNELDLEGEENLLDAFATLQAEAQGLQSVRDTVSVGSDIEAFANGLSRIRFSEDGEIPIFIGPIGRQTLRPDILPADDGLQPLRDYARIRTTRPPMSVGINVDTESAFIYPSSIRHQSGLDPNTELDQAAFALFDVFCADRAGSKNVPASCSEREEIMARSSGIALRWGYGSPLLPLPATDEDNEAEKKKDDEEEKKKGWAYLMTQCQTDGGGDRMGHALRFAVQNLTYGVSRPGAGSSAKCAYHTFIEAGDLFSGLPASQLDSLLRDKIVLVGADIPYLADNFDTPVYGNAPGIFIHAMALDNLIEMGLSADVPPDNVFFAMDADDLISGLIMAIAVMALIWQKKHNLQHPWKLAQPYHIRWASYAATILVFAIGSMTLISILRNWSLGNIFEVALSLLGMILILEIFAKEHAERVA